MMDGEIEEFTPGARAMAHTMFTALIILSWLTIVYAETFRVGITYLALLLVGFVIFLFKVAGLEIPVLFIGFKDEPGEDLALGFFVGVIISLPITAGLIKPEVNTATAPMAMGVIIAVPIVEELFFRGIIQPTVAEFTNDVVGILTQAMLFSLYHISVWGADINSIILGVIIGLLMGSLVAWRESIESAMVAHLMINMIMVLWGTLGGVAQA